MAHLLLNTDTALVPPVLKSGFSHSRRWARRSPLREVREADRGRRLAALSAVIGISAAVVAAQGAITLLAV